MLVLACYRITPRFYFDEYQLLSLIYVICYVTNLSAAFRDGRCTRKSLKGLLSPPFVLSLSYPGLYQAPRLINLSTLTHCFAGSGDGLPTECTHEKFINENRLTVLRMCIVSACQFDTVRRSYAHRC